MLVSAEMGLGHLRALFPLQEVMGTTQLVLGNIDIESKGKRSAWKLTLRLYNWVSRNSRLPLIGRPMHGLVDSLLTIPPYSDNLPSQKGNFPLLLVELAVRLGACNELNRFENNHPIVTSFYAPVIYHAIKKNSRPLICQICDTDLSRAWVPRRPDNSIHYMATCARAYNRLRSYGVPKENIHLSGFPLPHSLVGGVDEQLAKRNYTNRLSRLRAFKSERNKGLPLNILFAIGGAGAQTDIAVKAAKSLAYEIYNDEVSFTIALPPKLSKSKKLTELEANVFKGSPNFRVFSSSSHHEYFSTFSDLVANADVLWTKPSELTFYSSLGIPIIIAPPIGAQERANSEWLIENQIGSEQSNSEQANIWLMNLLHSNTFERMAQNGWYVGTRTALYSILDLIDKMQSNQGAHKKTNEIIVAPSDRIPKSENSQF